MPSTVRASVCIFEAINVKSIKRKTNDEIIPGAVSALR